MKIEIPYGKKKLYLEVEEATVLCSQAHSFKPSANGEELVKKALCNPIGKDRLCELARDKKHALIITSDHTRPVPSRVTMPLLLEELRLKNPSIEVKILVATGFHRPSTKDELIDKLGSDICDREEIINHISTNDSSMTYKGVLPSGGELWLNSLVDWADIVVSEGFIEPHFFAGFSGGRKSILPGIASAKTVLANHCSEFIASSKAKTGNLADNPIHKDMLYAAKHAGLAFILNVVIDADKKVIAAYAGDSEAAHTEGCKFVKSLASVKAVPAPIVVTSNGGYPLDQNIYQSVKGMTAAEACVLPGGVIIIAASCSDGHGGEGFYNWFKQSKSPREVTEKIAAIDRRNTLPDQWEAQILARVLSKCTVIMVTKCDRKIVEDMHMLYSESLEAALETAKKITGQTRITVIPDGVSVIVSK